MVSLQSEPVGALTGPAARAIKARTVLASCSLNGPGGLGPAECCHPAETLHVLTGGGSCVSGVKT